MQLFQSVKSRIYGAFGALTVLLVITGGAAISLMSNAEHLFADYRHAARQSLTVDEHLRDVSVLRIDFLNYLLTPTDEWAGKLREIITDIEADDTKAIELFADDPEALVTMSEVQKLATDYRAGFERIHTAKASGISPASHSDTKALTSIGPRMHALYDELSKATHERQNELGPRIAQQEALQLMIIGIISVVGVLIGLALAVVTGRWLTGTFSRLIATMGKLTSGDYDIEIAGTATQNELGEMARALETFRINGINMLHAEEEKQARAKDRLARRDDGPVPGRLCQGDRACHRRRFQRQARY